MQIPLSTKLSLPTYHWLDEHVKRTDTKKAQIIEEALQDYRKKVEKAEKKSAK